jgi:hypothetical protein
MHNTVVLVDLVCNLYSCAQAPQSPDGVNENPFRHVTYGSKQAVSGRGMARTGHLKITDRIHALRRFRKMADGRKPVWSLGFTHHSNPLVTADHPDHGIHSQIAGTVNEIIGKSVKMISLF